MPCKSTLGLLSSLGPSSRKWTILPAASRMTEGGGAQRALSSPAASSGAQLTAMKAAAKSVNAARMPATAIHIVAMTAYLVLPANFSVFLPICRPGAAFASLLGGSSIRTLRMLEGSATNAQAAGQGTGCMAAQPACRWEETPRPITGMASRGLQPWFRPPSCARNKVFNYF